MIFSYLLALALALNKEIYLLRINKYGLRCLTDYVSILFRVGHVGLVAFVCFANEALSDFETVLAVHYTRAINDVK